MENNENNNKRDNGGGGGGSRFSSFWIYGIIAVIFLGLNLVAMEGSQDPLPRNRLGQMLQNGDIEKIEVINKEVAHIYLKKDALSKSEYKDAAKTTFGGDRYHYHTEIGSVETFEKYLQEKSNQEGQSLI